MRGEPLAVAGSGAFLAIASVWTAVDFLARPTSADLPPDRPIEIHDAGYVSSNACRSCHPRNYESWHESYHRTMTQVATPNTVLGDFDDATAMAGGRSYLLRREGDEYWVEMKDPDVFGSGETLPWIRRRIVLVTGSHHMQVYWYSAGRGRELGQLPVVYLLEDRRWVPRTAIFLQPEVEHVSSETGRWNRTCIKCHTTNAQPRLDERAVNEMSDTHVAEFGIACEECHGPAEDHVRAHRNPLSRYRSHLTNAADPFAVEPRRLSGLLASQPCGQCHGILLDPDEQSKRELYLGAGFAYVPGQDLEGSRVLVRPTRLETLPALQRTLAHDPSFVERSFWSDGMVRVSGREYNGLVESPCAASEAFSCMSCHSLHKSGGDPRSWDEWKADQLKPDMDADRACTQCHEGFEDVTAHTHHAPFSDGSRCMNCHMPYTTYGLLKAIRSHQVSSPSVEASLTTGRPNACNQCHLDKTLAWSASHLTEWHGTPEPALDEDERAIAASVLWIQRGDAGQRALMAWSFGWDAALGASGEDWLGPYLAALLADPYAAVRYIAYRSLRRLPEFGDFEYDFVGPASERHDAAGWAFRMWASARAGAPRVDRETVLFGPEGLRAELFDRLLAQRDDRVVCLNE
jgi:hypothetical protein